MSGYHPDGVFLEYNIDYSHYVNVVAIRQHHERSLGLGGTFNGVLEAQYCDCDSDCDSALNGVWNEHGQSICHSNLHSHDWKAPGTGLGHALRGVFNFSFRLISRIFPVLL